MSVGGGSLLQSTVERDPFLSALEAQYHVYDENLLYACREYVLLHELNQKKHLRDSARQLIQVNQNNLQLPARAWLLLRYDHPFASRSGICYFAVQTMLAVASVATLSFESTPEYNGAVFPPYKTFWPLIDLPVAILLTADIGVYFFLLPQVPNEFSNGVSRRNFLFQPRVWLDLISTVPTFLTYLEGVWYLFGKLGPLKVLRVLRLVRALRALHSVDVLLHTLERSIAPLIAPLALFVGIVLFFSTAIYYAERGEYDPNTGLFLAHDCDCEMSSQRSLNPDSPCPMIASPFISIPHAMWFVVVTLATVGYGDMTPMCSIGRFLAVICMFLGSVVIAMPIAIVGMFYTNTVLANHAGARHDPTTAFGRKAPSASQSGGGNEDRSGGVNPRTLRRMAGQPPRQRLLNSHQFRGGEYEGEVHNDGGDSGGDDEDEEDVAVVPGMSHRGSRSDAKKYPSFLSTEASPALNLLHHLAAVVADDANASQTVSLLSPHATIVKEINDELNDQFQRFCQRHLSSARSVGHLERSIGNGLTSPLMLLLESKPLRCEAPSKFLLSHAAAYFFTSGFVRREDQQQERQRRKALLLESAAASISSSTNSLSLAMRQHDRTARDTLQHGRDLPICASPSIVPEVGVNPETWLAVVVSGDRKHVRISRHSDQRVELNESALAVGEVRRILVGDVVTFFHIRQLLSSTMKNSEEMPPTASSSSSRAAGVQGRRAVQRPEHLVMEEHALEYEFLRVESGSGTTAAGLASRSVDDNDASQFVTAGEELHLVPMPPPPKLQRQQHSSADLVAGTDSSSIRRAPLDDESFMDSAYEGLILVQPVDEALLLQSSGVSSGLGRKTDRDAGGKGAVVPTTTASCLTYGDYSPTHRQRQHATDAGLMTHDFYDL